MTGRAISRAPSERTASAARCARPSAWHSRTGRREAHDDLVALLDVVRPDRGEIAVRDKRLDRDGPELPVRVRDLDVERARAGRSRPRARPSASGDELAASMAST